MGDGFRDRAGVSNLVESPRIGQVNFINQLGDFTDKVESFRKGTYEDPEKS